MRLIAYRPTKEEELRKKISHRKAKKGDLGLLEIHSENSEKPLIQKNTRESGFGTTYAD